MVHLIDKDSLMAEIKGRINKEMYYLTDLDYSQGCVDSLRSILSFINTMEVKEVNLTDIKTKWLPTEKQLESLRDMLKYNIGVFDYQKFMDVNILYGELTKLLDYETDRQRPCSS